MADNDDLLQCYNKGCGKKYREEDNSYDACTYHPGVPIFHDAYKSWSCCQKRSTDFTVFLNFPGCTQSRHSNVKLVMEKSQVIDAMQPGEIEVHNQPKKKAEERPREAEPTIQLKASVASSLKAALEKKAAVRSEESKTTTIEGISIGVTCQNRGCDCRYMGDHEEEKQCVYHPGYPVFHEGMKFWSCCTRRTSDFTEFLKQTGCATGNHCWIPEKKNTQPNCRYDWHQTASHVYITIYGRVIEPKKSIVEANQVTVKIFLTYDDDEKQFDKHIILQNAIEPTKSFVEYLSTKAEIKLKKADATKWSRLEL